LCGGGEEKGLALYRAGREGKKKTWGGFRVRKVGKEEGGSSMHRGEKEPAIAAPVKETEKPSAFGPAGKGKKKGGREDNDFVLGREK